MSRLLAHKVFAKSLTQEEEEEEGQSDKQNGGTEDHSTRNRRDPERRAPIWTPWRQERYRRISSSRIRLPICIHSPSLLLAPYFLSSSIFFSLPSVWYPRKLRRKGKYLQGR